MMHSGYLGFDNVAASMSELWGFVRAVPAPVNKSVFLATHLALIR